MGAGLVEEGGDRYVLSVDQALEAILNNIDRLGEEERPVLDSQGQVAAEDVYAGMNVPDWDSATQDGYAVQYNDIREASEQHPAALKVTGRIVAGSIPEHTVVPGTAIRIMTGARIPPGADCVVRFEDTGPAREEGSDRWESYSAARRTIEIRRIGFAGLNIRKAGDMLQRGALLIRKGVRVGPGEVGVLAAAGRTHLRVIRRPVVAIIPTGEELVDPGGRLSGAQIYNSGSFAVAAQVKSSGGIPKVLPIARDTRKSLISRFRRGMKADAIITCGGTSAGDHDLVREVVSGLGKVVFQGVNMSPGRPFSFGLINPIPENGELRRIPHFALTGNPSAGMINFEVLVRPALLKMQGCSKISPELIEATLEDSFENRKGARCFIWGLIDKKDASAPGALSARIVRTPEKGILPEIAAANGLVIIPEDIARVNRGEKVKAMFLRWS